MTNISTATVPPGPNDPPRRPPAPTIKPATPPTDVPPVPPADMLTDLDASVVRSTRLWMGRQRWDQVVAEAVPAQAAARRQEQRRRREPRHPYRVSCLIRLGADGEMGVYSIDARNISRNGLGFRHDRLVDPDTPCLVALRDALGGVTLHAAIVRWCSPIDPIGFDTGVEFDQPIDAAPIARDTASR